MGHRQEITPARIPVNGPAVVRLADVYTRLGNRDAVEVVIIAPQTLPQNITAERTVHIHVGIGIVAAVIVTLSFFIINVGQLELKDIFSIVIVLILVGAAAYILWDRIKKHKKRATLSR